MQDVVLKEQYRHYDPLAIALKMLEVIIDNMGPFTGVTEDELYAEVCPLLERMDKMRNCEISHEDHIRILQKIFERIALQEKREGVLIQYTDYSVSPPEEKEKVFRLIEFRNYDGENVVLYAVKEAINIFLGMLDVSLEDKQQSELFLLQRQLKRGDWERSLERTKQNLRFTIQFQLKIQDIITNTRRNFGEVDWHYEVPKKLKNAEEHIAECLDSTLQSLRICNNALELSEESTIDKRRLRITLKGKLDESRELLLPLQKKVNEARKTFLIEQLLQEILAKKTDRIKFQEDFLNPILMLGYGKFTTFIDNLVPFYTTHHVSKSVTYDQLIELVFKGVDKIDLTPKLEKPSNMVLRKPLNLEKYPEQLRVEAVEFLVELLKEKGGKVTLDDLMKAAILSNKNFFICNYLRLLVQGRSVEPNFEAKFIALSLTINIQETYLENPLFQGNNFIIAVEEIQ